jgi:hypothetical protein
MPTGEADSEPSHVSQPALQVGRHCRDGCSELLEAEPWQGAGGKAGGSGAGGQLQSGTGSSTGEEMG